MKAYRIEILAIDFDGLGEGGIHEAIETARYPNRCLSPRVMKITERDIGEWDDEHPLNRSSLVADEYKRLFGSV